MNRTILIIFFTTMLLSCSLENGINNPDKRNENWGWVIDSKSGEGYWVAIGENTNIDDGMYTYFYSNGNISSTGKFVNRKDVDTTFLYDINGKLIQYKINLSDTNYHTYIDNNNFMSYYKTGEIMVKGGSVHNNKKNGTWIGYSKSGHLIDSITYVNGKANGLAKYWFKNGNLKEVTNWTNGVQNGLYTTYFENGSLQEKTDWQDGKREGEVTVWYPNGQIEHTGVNKNGEASGKFEKWYSNGTLNFTGNFLEGKKNGYFKYYYENGKVRQEGSFTLDVPEGLVKIYNENGMFEEQNYSFGQINGEVKSYDSNGLLIQTDIFINGNYIETKQ